MDTYHELYVGAHHTRHLHIGHPHKVATGLVANPHRVVIGQVGTESNTEVVATQGQTGALSADRGVSDRRRDHYYHRPIILEYYGNTSLSIHTHHHATVTNYCEGRCSAEQPTVG